jgi:hypothetical protein
MGLSELAVEDGVRTENLQVAHSDSIVTQGNEAKGTLAAKLLGGLGRFSKISGHRLGGCPENC